MSAPAPLPALLRARVPAAPMAAACLGAGAALLEGGGREPAPRLVAAAWLYGGLAALAALVLSGFWRGLRSGAGGARVPLPAAAALALVAVLGGLWPVRSPEPGAAAPQAPEILLITADTTRADRWWAVAEHARAAEEAAGGALEAGAASFEQAYAASALTAPAHASLFSGLYPHEHGVFNNGGRLARVPALAEHLRAAGYRTLAAASVLHLDPAFGFGRGFDEFAAAEPGLRSRLRLLQGFLVPRLLLRVAGAGRAVRPAAETLAAAESLWAEAAGPRPRLLWVHLFEPHWPYAPQSEDLAAVEGIAPWPSVPTPGYDASSVEEWRRRYDAEIQGLRRRLIPFVRGLEASASAGRGLLIVFTGDHGEAIGEHGCADHGDLLYEEQLRVPLWIRGPGLAARSVPVPVSHVDLLPTLCELAGADPPERVAGRSLAPALRGGNLDPVPIYGETRLRRFDNAMVRVGGTKLAFHHRAAAEAMLEKPGRAPATLPDGLPWLSAVEAYDLAADPWELRLLDPSAVPERAAASLRSFEDARGPALPEGPRQDLSPDVVEALAALGYL